MNLTIPVTAPFPLNLETRARIAAAKMRISRAELVRRATEEYLDRQELKLTPQPLPQLAQEARYAEPA